MDSLRRLDIEEFACRVFRLLVREEAFKCQGEWLQVSRELFLRGDQQHYKSPKNCRERWFNHVNPALSKRWTP